MDIHTSLHLNPIKIKNNINSFEYNLQSENILSDIVDLCTNNQFFLIVNF